MPRSENFTTNDRKLLVEILQGSLGVVENKKTDEASNSQKDGEWNIITEKFNAETKGTKREKKSLQTLWKNMKRKAKKDFSSIRLHRLSTGGGPSLPELDPFSEKIYSLIPAQIEPLKNAFDSDGALDAPVLSPTLNDTAILIDTTPMVVTRSDEGAMYLSNSISPTEDAGMTAIDCITVQVDSPQNEYDCEASDKTASSDDTLLNDTVGSSEPIPLVHFVGGCGATSPDVISVKKTEDGNGDKDSLGSSPSNALVAFARKEHKLKVRLLEIQIENERKRMKLYNDYYRMKIQKLDGKD